MSDNPSPIHSQEERSKERLRLDEALRQDPENLIQIMSTLRTVIWLRDAATLRILYVNPAYETVWGRSCQSLYDDPASFLEAVHPEDKTRILNAIEQQKDGRAFDEEYRIIRPDGTMRWVWGRTFPIRDEAGVTVRVVASVEDVTERREAEMATRRALALQAATLESTADGILVVDTGGRILSYNRNFAQLWGIPPSVLELRDDQSAIRYVLDGLEDPDTFVRKVGELYSQQEAHSHDTFRLKDGRMFERYSSPFRIGDVICGRVWSFRDATERKLAEKALRESEARYRELSDHSPLPVVVAALDGGAVLYINQHAADLFESSVDLLPSLNAVDFWVSPVARQRYVDVVRKVGHIVDYEALLRTAKGNEFLSLLSANATVFEGQRAIHVTVVDITDRRRNEQELIKAQKLESLAILAGGIAHDFNNLLTGILGNISLAQMQLSSPNTARERLGEAAGAALRARGLTQQLLTFSRGGAPVKRIADVAFIIREAALFATRGSSVACRFEFADNLWPAEVDEGQIAQVIQNLVINAVEAMPSGGIVTICAENLPLKQEDSTLLDKGPYLRVRVKDEGIGIQDKLLQRVFDPYFTTKQRGSGLGLSICHSIVTRHQGNITVTSRSQEGTTFEILLPATPGDSELEQPAPELGEQGEGRVLLMDDEDAILQMTARILESIGYEAAVARDGREALELFRKAIDEGKPYDVVILDLTVPGGMGGQETFARLKEIDPEVKAVVSSGYSNDPIMADHRAHGFAGVLIKPYQIADVTRALVPLAPCRERG